MDTGRELSGREMPPAGRCGTAVTVSRPKAAPRRRDRCAAKLELRMPVCTVRPRIGYAAGTPGPRPALACRPIMPQPFPGAGRTRRRCNG